MVFKVEMLASHRSILGALSTVRVPHVSKAAVTRKAYPCTRSTRDCTSMLPRDMGKSL